VREAGYRSKIAVYSNKLDVDPVGACVGPKGVRIQAVIRELEGEKIDILKYDEDPHVFIKNALSPAEVTQVVIRDAEKKEALAIVPESSFSLAIGKQGQNVRLANRLCDWLIDVKTEEQAAELDLTESDTRKAAESLFNDAADDSYEEVSTVSQLPGVDQKIAALLKDAGIDDIEKFMAAVEDGSAIKVQGVNADDIEAINKIISENVEFEDEEEKTEDAVVESSEETQEEEGYFCPECGERITLDMTHCPKCGAEFVFEEE
jgi:N utilization substance protein A